MAFAKLVDHRDGLDLLASYLKYDDIGFEHIMMLQIGPVTKTGISTPKAFNLMVLDSAFEVFDSDEIKMRCNSTHYFSTRSTDTFQPRGNRISYISVHCNDISELSIVCPMNRGFILSVRSWRVDN